MDLFRLDVHSAFLVSQKALIVENNKLLVLENTADEHGGQAEWELPGGLLNLDESLTDGLLREVKEEIGLEIYLGELFAVWDHWERGFALQDGRSISVRIIGIAYLAKRISGEIRLSEEHRQYCWSDQEQLRSVTLAQNSRIAIQKYLDECLL